MDSKHNGVFEREQRLDEVVLAYLKAVEAGQRPDHQELLDRHADLLPELAQFFEDADALGGLALRPRSVKPAAALTCESVSATITEGKELGDFRIVREVGKGGMGIVYEAEQMSLRRRVALKVLPFAAMMDPRHLQRFHNEARAASCLHHVHIVPVYFVGCERSVHFYAMQFIEGQSLAELIAVQRRISAREATSAPCSPDATTRPIAKATTQAAPHDAANYRRIAEWGIQAAEALEHAHCLGIVHRDIKPSNLMIDGAGKLWITDFGLARTATDAGLTMTGDVLGTLRYMSPEQALAKHGLVDHRADIYALGATLYELLSLLPTVDGIDREEILRKIAFEEPARPRSYDRAIPADLESIVLKALAKEPADRYSTAQELADELRNYIQNKPLQRTRPVRWIERIWRWCRRKPFLAILIALSAGLALAFVVGLMVSVWLITGQRDEIRDQYKQTLERERDLRIHLYAGDMKLAWQAWLQGDLSRVHELLKRHQPQPDEEDLRTFVWYYLQKVTRGIPVARSLDGHQGDVYYLAYSPDGQTLATAGKDGTTRLWDPTTGQQRLVLHGDGTEVNAVAFSPDGRTLATASDSGQVHLWDCAAGREQGTFRLHQREVATVAFSPDGKTLASGGEDQIVRLWDRTSLKEKAVLTSYGGRIEALAFSPDGKNLSFSAAEPKEPGSSPGDIGRVHHWNLAILQLRGGFSDGGRIYAMVYSHDGRMIAFGGDRSLLHLCDPLTFRLQQTWHGHMNTIQSVAFSPDDRMLASAGDDGVRVWDVASRSLRQVIPTFGERIWCVAFSPDGRTLATCGRNGAVRLYDLGTARHHKAYPTLPRGFWGSVTTVSPDGRTAAAQYGKDYSIRTWKVATGELGPACVGHRDYIMGLWFSTDGKSFLTTSRDKTARLWDLATGKQLVPPLCPPGPVTGAALSPDGSMAVMTFEDRAHFWDTRSGKKLEEVSLGENLDFAAFSPEMRTLAVCRGNLVQLWGLQTHRVEHILSLPSGFSTLAFSPDGTLLAAGTGDGTIKIWNARTGQELYTITGHRHRIAFMAISPDGKTLASGGDDHEVKLWDVRTGQEVASFEAQWGRLSCLVFTPDGKTLICAETNDSHG